MKIMDLGKEILAAVEAAAPLVGLAEQVAEGKRVVEAVLALAEKAKSSLDADDQKELNALIVRVKAHGQATRDSLG